MSGAHSILPPSGAKAWRRCPLWVTMNKTYPQGDTPESMEGTAAHWAFAEMLAGRLVIEGISAPNGVVITDEMIDGAKLVVETITTNPALVDTIARHGLHIEEAVACQGVHAECWGTPDIWAYSPDHKTLWIPDYKFGHKFVDEFENDQLMIYAAGIIAFLGLNYNETLINFVIIQPRCYYKGAAVRVWSVYANEIIKHINELADAADEALGPNPVAVTNAECDNCPGRAHCPALQCAAYSDAECATNSGIVELSPAAASLELRMLERKLERLSARVDGLKEVVKGHIRAGAKTPYHSLAQGYGRQVWTVPVDQVVAMGDLLGYKLEKPGVITPKAAIAKGIDEAVINAYSISPPGSFTLVSENPADARRVFGNN